MLVHIGGDFLVKSEDIVAVLSLEGHTGPLAESADRAFITQPLSWTRKKAGTVKERSAVITAFDGKASVYYSPVRCRALAARLENGDVLGDQYAK